MPEILSGLSGACISKTITASEYQCRYLTFYIKNQRKGKELFEVLIS